MQSRPRVPDRATVGTYVEKVPAPETAQGRHRHQSLEPQGAESAPADRSRRTANGTKGLIPAKYQGLFREIGQHESGHVALIGGVLGSAAVKAPMFDFTAGGRRPDVFSSFETFAMLSPTIEDVGVAAFTAQIGNLARTSVLSAALQIHSVEARHASSVRLVVGKSRSEGVFDKPVSKNEVLEAVKPFFV